MNPRYKTNKKWIEFPTELITEISNVFKQTFEKNLANHKNLQVFGRFYEKELILRIGINTKGELRFHNFEVSIDRVAEADKTLDLVYMAIDAVASLVTEYFENNEETEIPYTWSELTFDEQKIWVQYSTENSSLEAEANKLLGLHDPDDLLKTIDEEQTSADILDATEEQFDEFAEKFDPTMVGNKSKKDEMH